MRIYWIIPVLFIGCSTVLVLVLLRIYPHATPDNVKDFGVILGLGLTAIGTLCTLIVSIFTLSRQAKSARDLEMLKGNIAAQAAISNKSLDLKTSAYSLIMTAANVCYRELENLAKGKFDRAQVALFEKGLQAAEGSAALLDQDTRTIFEDIVQSVLNLIDLSEKVMGTPQQIEDQYKAIWGKDASKFGGLIRDLRAKAPFQNNPLTQ